MSLANSAFIMIAVFGLMAALPIGKIFGLTQIGYAHWLFVFVLSLVPTAAREVCRLIDNIPVVQKRRLKRKEFLFSKKEVILSKNNRWKKST